MDKLIVNYTATEKRFAYVRNHRVEKLVFDRPEQRSLVGNIYFGTVTKVLPGMNAAFIDIGQEKNAYLHRDVLASYVQSPEPAVEKAKKTVTSFVHQGEKLLVQVDKDATGPKGARVTGIIEIPGDHLIYMPEGRYVAVSKKIASKDSHLRALGQQLKEEKEGIIFRTSSITATEQEIAEELNQLRAQFKGLIQQAADLKKPGVLFQKDSFLEMIGEELLRMKNGEVIVDDLLLKKQLENKNSFVEISYYSGKENIFSVNRVEHEIDKALKRVVWLENGAYLIFDETEALTIIDVNTGKFSGKGDYQETVLKTNELAAVEVVRQLRLRDIGGIVLIDFIDMKNEKDKQSILATIENELRKDERRTKIIGFTPLGILQLTRKKTKVSISEALKVKCPVCEGTGRILSPETVAFRLERELLEHRHSEHEAVLIEATREVIETLSGHLAILEEMLHLKVYFSAVPFINHQYVIKQFGDENEIAEKAVDSY